MKIIENKTKFEVSDIIQIGKRYNNNKRTHLLINPMQAKHIPVLPSKPLELFSALGELLVKDFKDKNNFVIGFAETATAISAQVATMLGENTFYVHTTREKMNTLNIAKFEEEHSHAVEQNLFCNNPYETILKSDTIIFIEDEITTGKTIVNFINALKKNNYIKSHKIVVASIINAMDNLNLFKNMNIECKYLLKIKYEHDNNSFCNLTLNQHQQVLDKEIKFNNIIINGKLEPRVCVRANDYKNSCEKFTKLLLSTYNLEEFKNKSVLVLGTEEFMYASILVANKILDYTNNVKVHSTTRSPITAYKEKVYPINNYSKLVSFYCDDRETFLYNLTKYDKVLVITDANNGLNLGVQSLTRQLSLYGCENIDIIRWVE